MSQRSRAVLEQISSERQLNTIEEIDHHLQQNEHNLQTIENFLQNKRTELTELQNFLIKEFQEIQIWKQQKEKIIALLAHPLRQLLTDVKAIMMGLTKEFQEICAVLIQQTTNKFRTRIIEKDKLIQEKNSQIQEQAKIIEKMKVDLEKNIPSPSSKCQTSSSFVGLRQLSKQVSRKKLMESNNDKILSKSSFLDFHVTRIKSREKQKNNLCRSPNADRSTEKGLRSFKNYCQQEHKLMKSPGATRKIMFEVHQNMKDDLENVAKVQIEHKKYVKEKIECLKNKNSGIFNEYRPMKMERKF